jgi:hypothetical protein
MSYGGSHFCEMMGSVFESRNREPRRVGEDSPPMSTTLSTVVIGLIDRRGCAGCTNEHKFLTVCCVSYVDLSSECVTCEAYRAKPVAP